MDIPITSTTPFTPRSKKAIALAIRCAKRFGHHYIGAEHLLYGILTEREGRAASYLASKGISINDLENEFGFIEPTND
jgi:ATP-dependent Clp protease ATP-binding subunit ClpC